VVGLAPLMLAGPLLLALDYIAPVVVEAFLAGLLPASRPRRGEPGQDEVGPVDRREELALVRFLERSGSLDRMQRPGARCVTRRGSR
jgi:hypothetical protein